MRRARAARWRGTAGTRLFGAAAETPLDVRSVAAAAGIWNAAADAERNRHAAAASDSLRERGEGRGQSSR